MGIKKIKYGTNYFIIIIIILGIIAVINILSFRHFYRADLTENKEYTISESTKKILSGLDDIVNIKVYFSEKLPPYLVPLVEQIKDLLEEYRVYAKGNLEIEFIDPSSNPAMQQRMRFMGIPQVRLNIIEKDQAQFTNVYLGMAILYGDNKEIIPAVTDIFNFEYDLTSKILRVTATNVQTIGFLSGHGEPDLDTELKNIKTALEEHYYTKKVETKQGHKIGDDIAALVVASPKGLTQRDKFEIDQYLMSGGKVMFLIDPVELDKRRLSATPLKSNIDDLLENYGVKLKKELVLDRANANASFKSGFFSISVPYPFWVKIIKQNFDVDHPVVNHLESMVLPWAGPLEIIKDKTKGIKVTELAHSTIYSWTQKGYYDLNPRQNYLPPEDKLQQHIMAVALSGKFKSFFADKPVPPVEEQTDEKQKSNDKNKAEDKHRERKKDDRKIIKESPETKLIVVGNARFIKENFPLQFEENRIFFQNAIDWFTIGDYLINIRSRESTDRPLRVISERARSLIRFVNIFGISFLVGIFGIGRFYIRRRRKKIGTRGFS